MTMSAIDIDKLAPAERLRLIECLWESLRKRPEGVQLTSAQRDELDRRLDDLDQGTAEVASWDAVKQHFRSRHA